MRIDLDQELRRKLEYLAQRHYHAESEPEAVVRSMIEGAYRAERKREARMFKREQLNAVQDARRAIRQAAGRPVSGRLFNLLDEHEIGDFQTLAERYTEDEIMKWNQMGKRTMRELKAILRDLGLTLREDRAA